MLQSCANKEVEEIDIDFPTDVPHTKSMVFIHEVEGHDYLFVMENDNKNSSISTIAHAGSCWCNTEDEEEY